MKGSAWLAALVTLSRNISMKKKIEIPPHLDDPDLYLRGREYNRRKRIAIMAIEGAKGANRGAMCSSCAFKLDSPANLEPHNVDAALDALYMPGFVFNCHIEPGFDKGCECIGFQYAKHYLETLDCG